MSWRTPTEPLHWDDEHLHPPGTALLGDICVERVPDSIRRRYRADENRAVNDLYPPASRDVKAAPVNPPVKSEARDVAASGPQTHTDRRSA